MRILEEFVPDSVAMYKEHEGSHNLEQGATLSNANEIFGGASSAQTN